MKMSNLLIMLYELLRLQFLLDKPKEAQTETKMC